GRLGGITSIFMKGCTFNAQPGPFSSTKSSGVVFHGLPLVMSAMLAVVVDIRIGVRTSAGFHERASHNAQSVQLQRRDG
ncbi:hypothetical protein C8A03DRAFT_17600, partial [Achaetomium macrosporum]